MRINYNIVEHDYRDYLINKDYDVFFYFEIELKISERLTFKSEMHKAFLISLFQELEDLFKGKKKKKDDELCALGYSIEYIIKLEGRKIYIKEYDVYYGKTKSVSYFDKYDFLEAFKKFMSNYKKELAAIQPDIIHVPEFKEIEQQFQITLKAGSL